MNITMTVPQKLYRYFPLCEDKHLERVRCLISSCMLHAPTPKDFNDPFDCLLPIFDSKNIDPGFIKKLAEVRESCGGEPRTDGEQQICDGHVTDENLADLRSSIQERINRARMICFTECNDNILLWSHYANKHRGVCLEFDIDKWKSHNKVLQFIQVIYKSNNERPETKLTEESFNTLEFLKGAIFSKSLCWDYEQEWRLAFDAWKNDDFIKFLPDALTGVFFGVNSTKEDKEKILATVKASQCNPQIYDGSVHESQYMVSFTKRQ